MNIYKLNNTNYEIIQKLEEHKDTVNKVIELENEELISCSDDRTIKFWRKENNKYINYDAIEENAKISDMILINNNEIVYNYYKICLIMI